MGLPRTSAAAKALAWALAERALKTALYTFLGIAGTGALLNELDWRLLGWSVASATVLSVCGSLLSALDDGNPSLGSAEVIAAPAKYATRPRHALEPAGDEAA